MKKWDKRSKASTKEIYLSRQVEIQPVFNTDVLTKLQDQALEYLKDLEMKLASVSTGSDSVDSFLECPPHVVNYLIEKQDGFEIYLIFCLGLLKEWVEKQKHELSLSRVFLEYCTETSTECLRVLLESNMVLLMVSSLGRLQSKRRCQ